MALSPLPALLLALLASPSCAARLPPSDCAASAFLGPVRCAACASRDAGVNVVGALPRVSRLGLADANLGAYAGDLLDCGGGNASAAAVCAPRAPSLAPMLAGRAPASPTTSSLGPRSTRGSACCSRC